MLKLLYKIPFKWAVSIAVFMNLLIIVFHAMVLAQVIPFNIVWGGKFQDFNEVKTFEIISIVSILVITLIICIKAYGILSKIQSIIVNVVIWLFVVLFLLNTIGNLFAETTTETIIFTPLTLVFAILCARIGLEEKFK